MKHFAEPILVTRPYLPDLEEYQSGLVEIWGNQWLTNDGPMFKRFHASLSAYLQVPETNLDRAEVVEKPKHFFHGVSPH